MEHDHNTGKFRNIVCQSCNQFKADVKMQSNNTSGYKGIYKKKDKTCKKGFIWTFEARVNGIKKIIKRSIDFEFLKEFADKWKKDNNYYT
jgi:hypothetical protein